jgi:hypothetical protein
LLKATPGFEHKDKRVIAEIEGYLGRFLGSEDAHHPQSLFDWEGRDRRRPEEQERYYPVLGAWSFPDAAVLSPFKCAFEFDREPDDGGDQLKRALMKASVHVLSGAYEACVFVYILRPGRNRPHYLEDGSKHTRRLIKTLTAAGLYVAFIRS